MDLHKTIRQAWLLCPTNFTGFLPLFIFKHYRTWFTRCNFRPKRALFCSQHLHASHGHIGFCFVLLFSVFPFHTLAAVDVPSFRFFPVFLSQRIFCAFWIVPLVTINLSDTERRKPFPDETLNYLLWNLGNFLWFKVLKEFPQRLSVTFQRLKHVHNKYLLFVGTIWNFCHVLCQNLAVVHF